MWSHLRHTSRALEIIHTTSWSPIVPAHNWVILPYEVIIIRLLVVWVVVSLLEESMRVITRKLLPGLIALENLLLLILKNWIFPPNIVILMVHTLSGVQMALVRMHHVLFLLVALHQHLWVPFVQIFRIDPHLWRHKIVIVILLRMIVRSLLIFQRSLTCFNLVYRLFLRASELFGAFWEAVVIWYQL